MADNKKVYSIAINGITESIKQVDALSDALSFLDNKMRDIERRNVKVNTSYNGTVSSSKSKTLKTEDELLKQIERTERRIVDAQREDYDSLLASKDVLKEIVDENKTRAAQERLIANTYGNTMKGMKNELADIKKVMNTTDLGSGEFDKLVKRANELTKRLKEIESQYGQFGRNVGNYPNSMGGDFSKLEIKVNGVAREFDNARQALRTLTNERNTLKLMGKDVGDLDNVVKTLKSDIADMEKSSAAMDNLLDTMQSFTALASASQGISALFGMDDAKIEESIQKLVALQNVIQGVEVLRKQMQTGEGLGSIFSKSAQSVDTFVSNITGAELTAQGLTKSTKLATTAVRGLSLALKGIGFGLVMYGVDYLIGKLSELSKAADSTAHRMEALDHVMETLEKTFEKRQDIIASSYMSGAITAEDMIAKKLELQNDQLGKQITLLRERVTEEKGFASMIGDLFGESNSGFNAKEFTPKTISIENPISSSLDFTETVNSIKEVEREWEKCKNAVISGQDYFEHNEGGMKGWFASLFNTVSQTKEMMYSLERTSLSNFIANVDNVRKSFERGEISTEEYKKKIADLAKEMNSKEILQSALANLDTIIDDEKVVASINNIIRSVNSLSSAMNSTSLQDAHKWAQVRIDGMKDSAEKIRAQIKENMNYEIATEAETEEQKELIQRKYRRQEQDLLAAYFKNKKSESDKAAQDILNVEKTLNDMRMKLMKGSHIKTLAQLEYERRTRVAEAKRSGRQVQAQLALANELYAKEVTDARIRYYKELIDQENSYADKVKRVETELFQMQVENSRKLAEERKKISDELLAFNMTKDPLGSAMTKDINMPYLDDSILRMYGRAIENMQEMRNEYAKLMEEIQSRTPFTEDAFGYKVFEFSDEDKRALAEAESRLKEFDARLSRLKADAIASLSVDSPFQALDVTLWEREVSYKRYYESVLRYEKEYSDKILAIESERVETEIAELRRLEDERRKAAISPIYDNDDDTKYTVPKNLFKGYKDALDNGKIFGDITPQVGNMFSEYRQEMNHWLDSLKTQVNEGKMTWEEYFDVMNSDAIKAYMQVRNEYDDFLSQYNAMGKSSQESHKGELNAWTDEMNMAYVRYLAQVQKDNELHSNKMTVIDKKRHADLLEVQNQAAEREKKANESLYNELENESSRGLDAIAKQLSRSYKTNILGVIDINAARKRLKDLKTAIENEIASISLNKLKIEGLFKDEKIDATQFKTLMDNYNALQNQAAETSDAIKARLTELPSDFWQGIDSWIQEVGNTINDIMGSLSTITSNHYQKMIDEQDRYIDELKERYDKQREITEKYASDVETIEDELSTARGDRREQLIDALNAEMTAQRESLAQEQKINKEKEKAEQKKKKLEYEKAKAQKKMNIAQAIMNTAMAISMAAVNHWPLPAIPMMAMASAAGAAQIAAISSTPLPTYAQGGVIQGGVIQGPSHAQGGVKVLGGTAEVEGREFITNKVTTSMNQDLLYFINSKRKRIDLNDMIEFYADGKKVKEHLPKPTAKFASGGQLPSIRHDIALSDRLLTAFEEYSNRDVVVSVVDIIDRSNAVTAVRTLAGMEQ